jgi:hypothetical protein
MCADTAAKIAKIKTDLNIFEQASICKMIRIQMMHVLSKIAAFYMIFYCML